MKILHACDQGFTPWHGIFFAGLRTAGDRDRGAEAAYGQAGIWPARSVVIEPKTGQVPFAAVRFRRAAVESRIRFYSLPPSSTAAACCSVFLVDDSSLRRKCHGVDAFTLYRRGENG